MQLDQLFDNEVLRLNVPFHDFSFLGDLVNDADNSLDGRLPVGSVDPPDVSGCPEQAGPPFSKPTPISPHGQQGDRVSGLDSLRPKSGPGASESQIPPGLFIGIGDIKTGFIGNCPVLPL
jgi:hypothetical protein